MIHMKYCLDYNLIAILTEWDEFKDYDWKLIYKSMNKPAFIYLTAEIF